MSNPLHDELNRQLLKSVIMSAIFDSDGNVADVRKSILVSVTIAGKTTSELMSADKFDRLPDLAETATLLPEGSTIEVWDGRALFGKASHAGYVSYPVQSDRTDDPNQGVLL